jgi:OmpA-OmpF porin, OOP family
MKKSFFTLASIAAVALATPAFAQQGVPSGESNYDCSLYDECGAVQAAVEPEAPVATADEQVEGAPKGRTSRTRGWNFGAAKPAAQSGGWNLQAGKKPAAGVATARPSASTSGAKPARLKAPAKATVAPSSKALRTLYGQKLTFVSGSADLMPGAKAEVEKLALAMLRPDKTSQRFVIEGHTDAVGGREMNMALSRRRATAVADYLVELGVARERLDVVGLGFDKPLEGVSPRAAANRRVESKAIKTISAQ